MAILKKVRTNQTASTQQGLFQQKQCFCGKIVAFGLVSGDKGDYIDMWMIKITMKTNQIDTIVCFSQKQIAYTNHVCPRVWLFQLVFGL